MTQPGRFWLLSLGFLLDAAFVSPWLYGYVVKQAARIDAKRVGIYHHEAGQQVPGCAAGCVVPKQGDTITIQ